MMGISRRIVLMGTAVAAAAGLGLAAAAVIDRASEPDLAGPVQLVRDREQRVSTSRTTTSPPVRRDPVPVVRRVEPRHDVARRGVDRDDDGASRRADDGVRGARGYDSEGDGDGVDDEGGDDESRGDEDDGGGRSAD